MSSHRLISNQHRFMSRPLRATLLVTLALSVVPLAQADKFSSAVLQQSQSSTQNAATGAVSSASDKAAQHSIIFVGGRKQNDADQTINRQAHPPGPCHASQTNSAGADCSLNPQPIPPGRQMDRKVQHRDRDGLSTPTTPRRHRPCAHPREGCQ